MMQFQIYLIDLTKRVTSRVFSKKLLLAWFHSHFWKVEKVSYRMLTTFLKKSGWQFSRVSKIKTLNRGPLG
ncbi:hypothetical protein Godav_025852 [Gossypium davidsonii]|uniref:Uncharacterized protein n=2 Tax=Gossypium TaxID=3633 RepID=A0A7J8TDF8_GOSDV|nr:hypothetical protein [Gossypium davidsonii]MBA0672026.1 hypothetical protein [Gossypium klotzschianum]